MERDELVRFVLPIVVVLIAVVTFLVLGGLASQNPDGFEWALFEVANVTEPEGVFEGIWAPLGEGPLVDALVGTIGIVLVFVLAMLVFYLMARRE